MLSADTLKVWTPWVATTVGYLAAAAIVSTKHLDSWKLLKVFCLLSAARSACLMFLYLKSAWAAYFYFFWTSQCAIYICAFVLLLATASRITAGAFTIANPFILRLAIGAAIICCFVAALSVAPHAHFPAFASRACLYLNRALSAACLTASACLVFFVELSAGAWKRTEVAVFTGLLFIFGSDAVWSIWIELFGVEAKRYDSVFRDTTIFLGVLTWVVALIWAPRAVPFHKSAMMERK